MSDALVGMRPRLSRARKASYGLVTCAVILLSVEATGRVYYRLRTGSWAIPDKYRPPELSLYKPHPYLGRVLVPGTRFKINDKRIEINSLGFRGPEVAVPKPEGRLRIACVGGSTTFDTRVSSNEAAWPARLEALLRAETRLDVEVLNCGVPGYTSAESLIQLELRILDLSPDLVIIYDTYNDLKPAQASGFLPDYSHWQTLPCPETPGILHRALRTSIMFLKLERMAAKAKDHWELKRRRALSSQDGTLPEAAERTFRRNLTSMAALCRAHEAKAAFATFATRSSQFDDPPGDDFDVERTPNFNRKELQRAFRRYADLVREVAVAERAWLIDAQKLMPGGDLFADYVHFSDAGAERMARIVYEELERQGVWSDLAAGRSIPSEGTGGQGRSGSRR